MIQLSNDTTERFFKLGFFAGILSLRIHNNSNNMGTSNVKFICSIIVQHQNVKKLQFGRDHLPTVFNYLFKLINSTSHVIFSMSGDDKKYTRTHKTKMRENHNSAQKHILAILKGLESSDLVALAWLRDQFFLFLLHGAKWIKAGMSHHFHDSEPETKMTEKYEEDEADVENKYFIFLLRDVFDYIMEHLDTFTGNMKQKLDLLEKMEHHVHIWTNEWNPSGTQLPSRVTMVLEKMKQLQTEPVVVHE